MFEIEEKLQAYFEAENKSIDMPSKNHAKSWSQIVISLAKYRKQYDIYSQLLINLNDWNSIPDICLFPSTKSNWLHDEIVVTQVPVLVIEILSPTQGMKELTEKFESYFKNGVKSCWLIMPLLKTVMVMNGQSEQQIFSVGIVKDALLNIEVELEEIFE
jgi:Uma2 family endonuclease